MAVRSPRGIEHVCAYTAAADRQGQQPLTCKPRFATNLPAGNWTQMFPGQTNSWTDLNIAGMPQKFYQAFEQ
jgi:hypothetical protein